jgi:tRNA-2-methylthio-N6-dimethylallyladenosine synthase
LHLPLQSGDNDCLRRMKRTYTIEKYRRIIDSVRDKIPNVAVTTDAIVGFCGETEAEFQNTLKAFREIEFDQAFMFAYSPRHTTEAWAWPDDVEPGIKQRRLAELIALQNEISREKNRRVAGHRVEVLVEGVSDKDASRMMGRTRTNKLVLFPGTPEAYPTGSFVEVQTQEAFLWGFVGEAASVKARPIASRQIIELQAV